MKKIQLFLTQDEWRMVIASLNAHRNKLIAEGRHTDLADDVILKAMTAPTKMIKIT